MLTESFYSIAIATRQLLRNRSVMIVLAGLYASLIAALYVFVTIREATTGQVILSLVLAITAPVLFFVLQSASVSQGGGLSGRCLLIKSLKNSWKLITLTVPIIGLAVLSVYLSGKAQSYLGTDARELSDGASQYQLRATNDGATVLRWNQVLLNGIRYLFLGLVLPLVAIHLWIASVGNDLLATIKATRKVIVGAFAPSSVLIYMAGFVVFGVVPYVLLFKPVPAGRAWMEFTFFAARLLLVFVLTLFGWVVTMSALAISVRTESGSDPVELKNVGAGTGNPGRFARTDSRQHSASFLA